MALALQGAGWLQPLRGGDAGAEEGDHNMEHLAQRTMPGMIWQPHCCGQ